MKEKLGKIIPLITAGVAILFELLKKFSPLATSKTASIVFYLVLGILIIFLILNFLAILYDISLAKKSKKLYDTSSILTRTKVVTKDLTKIINKIDVEISKKAKENVTLSAERENEIKKMDNDINIIFNNEGIKLKNKKVYHLSDITSRDIKRDLKNGLDISKVSLLNEIILNSINEMERALLVLEQYDTRIFLGNYVLKHSNDVLSCANAYIDLKGWTYSLLGKTSLFKENVLKGINLLEEYLKNTDIDEKMKFNIYIKLARSYRHLGSDIISAQIDPLKAVEFNKKANGKLKLASDLNENFKNDNKYIEMEVGIEYGIVNAYLYHLRKSIDLNNIHYHYNLVLDNLKSLSILREKASTFSNPHRYIKCVLLENEYIKFLESFVMPHISDKEIKEKEILKLIGTKNKESLFEAFVGNTKLVENKFKQAIYVDEMMETYINQEVNELYKRIEGILQ